MSVDAELLALREALSQVSIGHRLDPRCRELMPTDGRCSCGYAAIHAILTDSAPVAREIGQRIVKPWRAVVECLLPVAEGDDRHTAHARACVEEWPQNRRCICGTAQLADAIDEARALLKASEPTPTYTDDKQGS